MTNGSDWEGCKRQKMHYRNSNFDHLTVLRIWGFSGFFSQTGWVVVCGHVQVLIRGHGVVELVPDEYIRESIHGAAQAPVRH